MTVLQSEHIVQDPCSGFRPEDGFLDAKIMKVTKQFLFEILEDSSRTILFTGVVNNICD